MITFREITGDELDLKFLNKVRNSCAKFLHDPRTFTIEETLDWFSTLPTIHRYHMIMDGTTPIGYFRLVKINDYTYEIGADLHENHRGKGKGYEAYLSFFSKFPHDTKLELSVLGCNIPAYNLYRKLGFKVDEEDFEEINRDGKLYPSLRMYLWI